MGQPAGRGVLARLRRRPAAPGAAAHAAYDDLASRFDVVVAEGAGSPAEINLRASDYVNMGLARHAATADRRGRRHRPRRGVRRDLRHAWRCSSADDQRLVAGFVVNKFRGDDSLLAPGLDALAPLTGRRCYGVLPWRPRPVAGLRGRARPRGPAGRRRAPPAAGGGGAAAADQQLHRRRRARPRARPRRRLRLRPRATSPTPTWSCCPAPARRSPTWPGCATRGLDRAVAGARRAGAARCSGSAAASRCSGATIADPDGVEGPAGRRRSRGSGCSTSRTDFGADKVLRLPTGSALGAGRGYEIHHGRVTAATGEEFLGGARAGHGVRDDVARQPGGRRASARAPAEVAWPRWRAVVAVRGELPGGPRAPARPARRPGRGAPRRRRAAVDLARSARPPRLPVAAAGGRRDEGAAARRHRRGARARGRAGRRRRRGRLVAGRPGGPAAAAGRRGADRRVRRGRRACADVAASTSTPWSTRPIRSPPAISANAAAACASDRAAAAAAAARLGGEPAVDWHWVDDHDEAAAAAAAAGGAAVPDRRPPAARRVRRAAGAPAVLARVVDPPEIALPADVAGAARPRALPASRASCALMRTHRVDVLVTKDSGGAHTRAKLDGGRRARRAGRRRTPPARRPPGSRPSTSVAEAVALGGGAVA